MNYGLKKQDVSVRFKDNGSHLFSTKTLNSDFLKKTLKSYHDVYLLKIKDKKINKKTTFKSYLLDIWVKDKNYKGDQKRVKKIGISVERCIYNSTTVTQFKNFLTAEEQNLFKKRISEKLKSTYKSY